MPKLLINLTKPGEPPMEIDMTEKEAAIATRYWMNGADVIIVGGRPWNTKYIIGIAEGGEKQRTTLKIEAGKNRAGIQNQLNKMREELTKKGIINGKMENEKNK